ncbi:ATP-binding protein [Streptomyces millisiae]|uniref:ATP-binding protein n=1 Tax=Streptomyces millisiae TaxID=3075542 RepID=A0ABU2LJG5_9ACTN|nr:ATP-binding protein [Streptomyces sp. DSM 44918]MDT0317671.1 ATP-binding protein [Streptomyces sp. DSM 44918]
MSSAFRVQLSSSRRGAHLARQLAVGRLARHGIARTTPTSFAIGAITAELAANAVTHGRLPGRDFVLTLALSSTTVRVEVLDGRPDLLPPTTANAPSSDALGGRGLLVVDAFADRWGCVVRGTDAKYVWAEVNL